MQGLEENPEEIKIELLSKSDYNFLYEHRCDVFDYQEMREAQGLHPQYVDYLTMLIKLFNHALTTPKSYKCLMQLNKDNSGDLFINEILPYKQVQMLGCHFE